MLRKLYLSPLGYFISLVLRMIAVFKKDFMIYGYVNQVQKKWMKNTRYSTTAMISDKKKIDIADNVWIGHYCILDGIGGITIEEGVNLASHTCIYTHSSSDAIRLLGRAFISIPAEQRPGYTLAPVIIGAYTFVGTQSVILPGVSIGKGCIIGAGSLVNKDVPDFAIVGGVPVKVLGDTRERDKELIQSTNCAATYYLNINTINKK